MPTEGWTLTMDHVHGANKTTTPQWKKWIAINPKKIAKAKQLASHWECNPVPDQPKNKNGYMFAYCNSHNVLTFCSLFGLFVAFFELMQCFSSRFNHLLPWALVEGESKTVFFTKGELEFHAYSNRCWTRMFEVMWFNDEAFACRPHLSLQREASKDIYETPR